MSSNQNQIIDFDPSAGFKHAESIRQTLNSVNWMQIEWQKCGGNMAEYMIATLPSRLVIGALLCEIYLKSLNKLTGKDVTATHKLLKLFQSLNGKDRDVIEKNYKKSEDKIVDLIENSPYPNVFQRLSVLKILKNHNDSFVSWRYLHENDNNWLNVEGSLELVADAVRDAILFHKPEWKERALNDGWRITLGKRKAPSFKEETDEFFMPHIFIDHRK